MLPDFLIVGAQRCGTTSFYKTLVEHPAVMSAVLHKGVHYFDTGYDRGASWYQGHFPTRAAAQRLERRSGTRPLTGESSPYYMFHPLAAERIATDLPAVKLVVLLRDPVDRAHSAHAHERARGHETLPFEEALAAEKERLDGEDEKLCRDPGFVSHTHQHNAYVTRGQYIDQVRRLEAAVGRDRMCLVDSDAMFADPVTWLHGVEDFLGLERWAPPHFEKRNARPRASMPEDLRRRLEDHFAPYDEDLAAWWGRRPSWRP
jgi:hypothetical protein